MHTIKTVLIGIVTVACCLVSWAFASLLVFNQQGGGLIQSLIDGHLGLIIPVAMGIVLDLGLPTLAIRMRKWLMVTLYVVGFVAFIGYTVSLGILGDPSVDMPAALKRYWLYLTGLVSMIVLGTVLVQRFFQITKSGGSLRNKPVQRVTMVTFPPGDLSRN